MRQNGKRSLMLGSLLLGVFAVWTALIQLVDVQPLGVNETDIGFAVFNTWFHRITGVHMDLYIVTDWLGLVPVFVCLIFGGIGAAQLIKRRSFFKVDCDIVLLGVYYGIVIAAYLVFEMIPINYRPILIEGVMEVSYPSSTTLLVLSVMPTLAEQVNRRLKNRLGKRITEAFVISFSCFMIIGRLISGVHWFTDIVGALLISAGLFYIYKAFVLLGNNE